MITGYHRDGRYIQYDTSAGSESQVDYPTTIERLRSLNIWRSAALGAKQVKIDRDVIYSVVRDLMKQEDQP